MLLYIGPGISLATVVIVLIVVAIVVASIVIVLWRSIKRFFSKAKKTINGK